MEDTVKKARNYAWKCFAVLSVGAVIHLIVSLHQKLWFVGLLWVPSLPLIPVILNLET